MAKNIIICCDGTSNEIATDHTNVLKLFSCLEHSARQTAYYHPGVGTMEPPGAFTTVAIATTKFLGLATGFGLFNDIRDAYVFLMNSYQPGDKVFLFGFSRGAYEVRALASLLHLYGLIRRGNEALVPYALRMMSAVNNASGHSWGAGASARNKREADKVFARAPWFRRAFSVDCKPHFVGVWDTVSSVGLLSNPFHTPYTTRNPSIEHGCHAMAMDERRGVFPVSRWFPAKDDSNRETLKQVWFAGDHCDVGGGHPENESGLSKIAFEWVVCEAVSRGLLVNPRQFDEVMGYEPVMETGWTGETKETWPFAKPDPVAKPHDSLNFSRFMGLVWHLMELLPRRKFDFKTKSWPYYWRPFRNKRVVPHGDASQPAQQVHDAVRLRDTAYRDTLPPDAVFEKTVYPQALAGTKAAAAGNAWVAPAA